MKVQWGAIVTDGKGKIGGQVLSANRGGAYMRTKVIPHNPQSIAQQNARYLLVQFSKSWKTLTQAEIAAWVAAGPNWIGKNNIASSVTPTGKNLYERLNINLANIGMASISSPPVPASLSQITDFTATFVHAGAVTLHWTSGAVPAAEGWIIRATAPVSPGKSFVKNLFRIIDVLPAAAASPNVITAAYNAKFGSGSAGQKVYFSIEQIDNTSGTSGIPIQCYCILT
jgi:hypothetical protein